MLARWRKAWDEIRDSPVGRRFQRRHQARVAAGKSVGWRRVGNVTLGVLIALVGIVLVPAPGPGWAIIFLGLGLLAGEIFAVARFLDRVEVRVRGAGRRIGHFWAEAAWPARIVVLMPPALLVALLAVAAYRVFAA
jgi:hypothetical protein